MLSCRIWDMTTNRPSQQQCFQVASNPFFQLNDSWSKEWNYQHIPKKNDIAAATSHPYKGCRALKAKLFFQPLFTIQIRTGGACKLGHVMDRELDMALLCEETETNSYIVEQQKLGENDCFVFRTKRIMFWNRRRPRRDHIRGLRDLQKKGDARQLVQTKGPGKKLGGHRCRCAFWCWLLKNS